MLKIYDCRTFAFEEGTVGSTYTTETAQDCLEKCVGMIKCMAYTYEVVSYMIFFILLVNKLKEQM